MRSRLLPVLALVLAAAGRGARGEPSVPMEARAAILRVELNRGPARDLDPFLGPSAGALAKQYAIRALGRIGEDDPEAVARLRTLLDTETEQRRLVLWAAGLARAKSLAEPIAKHLASDDPATIAAAALALGWAGDVGQVDALSRLLARAEPLVVAAALRGIGRLRVEGLLERAATFLGQEGEVGRAAAYATWSLAAARRRAARAVNPAWDGEPAFDEWPLPAGDPERRMDLLRVWGALLPRRLGSGHRAAAVIDALLGDPDPRVVQDLVWRVLTEREGPLVEAGLGRALSHADAKVRHLAAEALGALDAPDAGTAIQEAFDTEQDRRLRGVLAVSLMRQGIPVDLDLLERSAPEDAVLRPLTRARALLASRGADALVELLEWADPSSPSAAAIPPVAWMEVAEGLKERDDPIVREWIGWMLAHAGRMDSHVLAAVVELAGEQGGRGRALRDLVDLSLAAPVPDVAVALAKALAATSKREGVADTEVAYLRAALRRLLQHPSAFARRAAREAMTGIGMEIPAPRDRANDWRGLPRPEGPVLGLDLAGAAPWLSEAEILAVADRIAAERPRIVFDTTAGRFAIVLEPEHAPVHAANVLLCALSGVYDGTRWHRVVPNFVIQGGDPHGHGAGGAGWTVPDEIGPLPFARGAVGMPKSTKDDGGCQLFVMHTGYEPLDERYTRFGRVVDGMDAVDRIRVGDRILGARVVLP